MKMNSIVTMCLEVPRSSQITVAPLKIEWMVPYNNDILIKSIS